MYGKIISLSTENSYLALKFLSLTAPKVLQGCTISLKFNSDACTRKAQAGFYTFFRNSVKPCCGPSFLFSAPHTNKANKTACNRAKNLGAI